MSVSRAHSHGFPLFIPPCHGSFVSVGGKGIDPPSDLWKGDLGLFHLPAVLPEFSLFISGSHRTLWMFPAHSAHSSLSCLCTSFYPETSLSASVFPAAMGQGSPSAVWSLLLPLWVLVGGTFPRPIQH